MVDSLKSWKLIKISREKLHGLQTVTVYCVFVLCGTAAAEYGRTLCV